MENNPVKLLFDRDFQGFGVVADPVKTDIDLPGDPARGFGKVKSDDIGIKIVLQVFFIDGQQGLVCTKDIVQRIKAFALLFGQLDQKSLQAGAIPEGKDSVLRKEVDSGHAWLVFGRTSDPGPITKFVNKSHATRLVLHHSSSRMKLSDLKPGQEAVITHFENNEIFLKLMEMGCVPGERILVEQVAPLGDPISVSISGYQLSLRLSEADNIMVDIIN